jgi:hypothetical protein
MHKSSSAPSLDHPDGFWMHDEDDNVVPRFDPDAAGMRGPSARMRMGHLLPRDESPTMAGHRMMQASMGMHRAADHHMFAQPFGGHIDLDTRSLTPSPGELLVCTWCLFQRAQRGSVMV